MAKKTMTYKESITELEEIIQEMEENQMEIDDLAAKAKRATELIKLSILISKHNRHDPLRLPYQKRWISFETHLSVCFHFFFSIITSLPSSSRMISSSPFA